MKSGRVKRFALYTVRSRTLASAHLRSSRSLRSTHHGDARLLNPPRPPSLICVRAENCRHRAVLRVPHSWVPTPFLIPSLSLSCLLVFCLNGRAEKERLERLEWEEAERLADRHLTVRFFYFQGQTLLCISCASRWRGVIPRLRSPPVAPKYFYGGGPILKGTSATPCCCCMHSVARNSGIPFFRRGLLEHLDST